MIAAQGWREARNRARRAAALRIVGNVVGALVVLALAIEWGARV